MNDPQDEMKELRLDDLEPFPLSLQTYEGERLAQFMNDIEANGLNTPIIVRPKDNDKYEIICGHNRVKAMRALRHDTIKAIVKIGLTDEKAEDIFFGNNLNQQSFNDWNYAQKIRAIQHYEKKLSVESQQGKRTDLANKKVYQAEVGTSVQTRQKLAGDKKIDTRGKMARRLGISTATFSKYRRIIKLPDETLEPLIQLLDQKCITFEAAYIISGVKMVDAKWFISKMANKPPSWKVDLAKLKEFQKESNSTSFQIYLPAEKYNELFIKPPFIVKPIPRIPEEARKFRRTSSK